MRAGLAACLSREDDIEVVAELDRREPVLPTVASLRPDVAVIDDGIAALDGFAIIHDLYDVVPACRTLIMATRPCAGDLRRAAAAHATGFMRKDAAPESVSQAVRSVAQGTKVLDPDLAFAALDVPANPMTPRETDVLRVAAAGAPTAEIARKLCLTPGTVRNHISAVITKTGARNRVDAILIADRCGWL